ncbi:prolipoprotein diacylglyceryl transferase [Sandarakinorhabdus sp.]|uniref:prolipoprotein diacylglyceryl transferase n=1 Tax=Sandarakinorhabdus sp. TaxID=1916663 RepID=UPI00286E64EA|nr:prolipoprotein diacylglyceryl transferase [Sandarakinorhabdus sp.]
MFEFYQAAINFADLPLSPELFSVPAFELLGSSWGPFALRWYSLSYIAGIIFAWWMLLRMARLPAAPMTAPQTDDFITWATLGVILGGRLGYVLFYNLAKFMADPIQIIRVWDGGMSSHGGALGVILACLFYGWKHRLSGLRILDHVAVVTPVGLGLGRLANFNNGELWGRPTGTDWGVIFPGAGPEPRYPSQLFEAGLEGAALFIILFWLFWRTDARLRPGLLAGVFGVCYGVFRFIVEYFREPDVQLGVLSTGLTMGQTLTVPLILAGGVLVARAFSRKPVVAA